MRIAILGTRGIPNNYGGFEQWAEFLSQGLVERGCEVYVYNSHKHPYQKSKWNGVNIIHCYDPEYKMGTVGQFIYDFNCILDSRKRNFDIILQLGFTSSAIWGGLLPRKPKVITNMDGLEWKRKKFNKITQYFLKISEKLAVYFSDCLIADSPVIKDYYLQNYQTAVEFIPYGTSFFTNPDMSKLSPFKVMPFNYKILVARLEPENNIEMIIEGVLKSKSPEPLLIIGSYTTAHGKYLHNKYQYEKQIQFLGGIFNKEALNNLRYYSSIYFHGHSVGGTNPSLLEAMASSAKICAHDNPYNRSVLANNGPFFKTPLDIATIIDRPKNRDEDLKLLALHKQRLTDRFLLDNVIGEYYHLLKTNHHKNN